MDTRPLLCGSRGPRIPREDWDTAFPPGLGFHSGRVDVSSPDASLGKCSLIPTGPSNPKHRLWMAILPRRAGWRLQNQGQAPGPCLFWSWLLLIKAFMEGFSPASKREKEVFSANTAESSLGRRPWQAPGSCFFHCGIHPAPHSRLRTCLCTPFLVKTSTFKDMWVEHNFPQINKNIDPRTQETHGVQQERKRRHQHQHMWGC